jgi:hypothetical protein
VHAAASDYDAAQPLLYHALAESPHIPGNHRATAWGYAMLGDVLGRLGQRDKAGRALEQARHHFLALGAIDGTRKVDAKRS